MYGDIEQVGINFKHIAHLDKWTNISNSTSGIIPICHKNIQTVGTFNQLNFITNQNLSIVSLLLCQDEMTDNTYLLIDVNSITHTASHFHNV